MSSTIHSLGTSQAGKDWSKQLAPTKLGGLKLLFMSKEKSIDKFNHAREHFVEAFQSQIKEELDVLPKGAHGPFLKKAYESLDKILELTFDHAERTVNDSGYSKSVHRQMVQNANELAVGMFKEIGKEMLKDGNVLELARQENKPENQPPVDGNQRPRLFIKDGRIEMRGKAPPLENLIFRGGGAKGIGNAPAIKELEVSGSLKEVKRVVGTSAGALTALSLASGYDADRFTQLIKDNPMAGMAGKVEGFKDKYPMVKLEGAAGKSWNPLGWKIRKKGGGSGEHALQVADKATAGRVSEFLKDSWNTEAFQRKLVEIKDKHGEDAVKRLALLKETPNFETDRTGKMITFKDLSILSEIAPDTFKELTLTGYDKTNKQTVYFDAKRYPDMPVAIAGRISMSIPVAFQTVKYDPGDKQGMRKWVDGGVGSNMPSEVVMKNERGQDLQGREREVTQGKTLLFTYAEQEGWKKKIHGKGKFKSEFSKNLKGALFAGNSRLGQVSVNDNKKIHNGGVNTFVVHHYDIDTMHLQATKERVDMAQAQSTLMALKQIEHRQGMGISLSFDTVEDILPYLTDTDKEEIRAAGPPLQEDYPPLPQETDMNLDKKVRERFKLEREQRFEMETKLYDMVANDLGVEERQGGVRNQRGGDLGNPFEDDPPKVLPQTVTGSRINLGDDFLQPGDTIDLDNMTIIRQPKQPHEEDFKVN